MAKVYTVKVTTPQLQINTVSASVAGQIWTATDTVGNGSWQTATSGGGTVTTSAPVTVGKYTKWASSTSLTDSLLSESGSILTLAGSLTVNSGIISLTGTTTGRVSRSNTSTVDASGQAGSGSVIGTDDSGLVIKLVSGQSAIFDNDGGILSLPTSGAVTIPAVYGGQNPPMTNTGGATSGSNTVTLLVSESIAAQGTLANATVTTGVALDIGAMSAGGTNNYGIRIAAPSGGSTVNRAIDVASGQWYVDQYGGMTIGGGYWSNGYSASDTNQRTSQVNTTFNLPTASTARILMTGGTFGSNGTTPTITKYAGIEVTALTAGTISAGTTVTTWDGISIPNQPTLTNTTITTAIGLDIGAMNAGGTSNYGIRIASSAGTGYRAIDVNAGAFWVSNTGNITTSSNIALNGGQITTTATGLGLPTYVNIGSAVGNTNQALAITSTLAAPASSGFTYGFYHSPTLTLTNATTTGIGILTSPTINTATGVNISNAVGIQINPIVGTGGGTVTLSTLYGLYINTQGALTGISTLTTAYGAFISGPSTGTTRYGLYLQGGSTSTNVLYITNTASSTVNLATFDASPTTNAQKVAIDKTGHIAVSQAAVPTQVVGTGAGTGAAGGTITGTDQSGKVLVTTGTTPTINATVTTVSFRTTYATIPNAVILTPATTLSAQLSGATQVYVSNITATTFTITSGPTAITTGSHGWFYQVL